jgi:hypothetical protein
MPTATPCRRRAANSQAMLSARAKAREPRAARTMAGKRTRRRPIASESDPVIRSEGISAPT